MMRLMGRRSRVESIRRWMRSKHGQHRVKGYKNGRLALQRETLGLGAWEGVDF